MQLVEDINVSIVFHSAIVRVGIDALHLPVRFSLNPDGIILL